MSRNREAPPDVLAYIKKLEERVSKLESNNRLGFSSVNVGTFNVDGAKFTVLVSGTKVLEISADVGGNAQPGFNFWFATGHTALSCWGNEDGQFIGMWDGGGHIIASSDGNTKFGLGRPWLPIPFTRSQALVPVNTTTSASFVTLQFAKYQVQHPKFYALLSVRSSDGTTTGEYQAVLGGQVVGDVHIINGNDFFLGEITEEVTNAVPFGTFQDLEIQARRTAGAGTIGVDVLGAYGRQS